MKKIKALLYCTKANLSLYRDNTNGNFFTMKPCEERYSNNYDNIGMQNRLYNDECCTRLNGTIVAECEIEVEEIFCVSLSNGVGFDFYYYTDTITDVREKSCLDEWQLQSYLGAGIVGEKVGYALHISNLKVFDKPRELSEYSTIDRYEKDRIPLITGQLSKAPQNMCYAMDEDGNLVIVISIQPNWMCKILNREKDVEVRKSILNCMKELIK